jgi:hypothetical protein
MSTAYRGIEHYGEYDISRIASMEYRKRWFMILDRDLPFELTLRYYDPHNEAAPVIGYGKHPTVSFIPVLKFFQPVSIRMRAEDVHENMECIMNKSQTLDQIRSKDIALKKSLIDTSCVSETVNCGLK